MPGRRHYERHEGCFSDTLAPLASRQHPHEDVMLEPVVRRDIPVREEVLATRGEHNIPDIDATNSIPPGSFAVVPIESKSRCDRTDVHEAPADKVQLHHEVKGAQHVETLVYNRGVGKLLGKGALLIKPDPKHVSCESTHPSLCKPYQSRPRGRWDLFVMSLFANHLIKVFVLIPWS